MGPEARRSGSVWEGMYRLIMRRTPIYVTFVVVGAFLGERAVDYGIRRLWEHNNVGDSDTSSVHQVFSPTLHEVLKRYEDIPVLGQRPSE